MDQTQVADTRGLLIPTGALASEGGSAELGRGCSEVASLFHCGSDPEQPSFPEWDVSDSSACALPLAKWHSGLL